MLGRIAFKRLTATDVNAHPSKIKTPAADAAGVSSLSSLPCAYGQFWLEVLEDREGVWRFLHNGESKTALGARLGERFLLLAEVVSRVLKMMAARAYP